MSMISATLSHSALALVVGQTTATGVWDTLERRYTSISRSNILGLKRELNSIRKNNDSIDAYMAKIKDCRTKLEAVGVHVEDEELLHIVLDKLPQGYYSSSSPLGTRNDPIGYEQVHVLLTSEEKSLKHASELIKDPVYTAMIGQRT
nr:hypothetical protein CFP56_01994 [Quercus suber]